MKFLTIYFVVMIALCAFITIMLVAANAIGASILFACLTALLCYIAHLVNRTSTTHYVRPTRSQSEQQYHDIQSDCDDAAFFNALH